MKVVANLDGMEHVKGGDCCWETDRCRKCGARRHFQGIYGGYIEVCEECPEDAAEWREEP